MCKLQIGKTTLNQKIIGFHLLYASHLIFYQNSNPKAFGELLLKNDETQQTHG